jgi:hypothetical protein
VKRSCFFDPPNWPRLDILNALPVNLSKSLGPSVFRGIAFLNAHPSEKAYDHRRNAAATQRKEERIAASRSRTLTVGMISYQDKGTKGVLPLGTKQNHVAKRERHPISDLVIRDRERGYWKKKTVIELPRMLNTTVGDGRKPE